LIYPDLKKQLSGEISALEPQTIYIGMNSDPYQPLEKKHQQTRKALRVLHDKGFSVSILTRSPLILRDLELIKEMPGSSVGISLAFSDDKTRRLVERAAPSNRQRIRVLQGFKEAGVKTYTLICPVMPYLTDVNALIKMAAPYTGSIWVERLHPPREDDINWRNIQDALKENFPELLSDFREAVLSREHPCWKQIRAGLVKLRKEDLQLTVNLNLTP